MLSIAGNTMENSLVMAPMAGVTDSPFRQLVKEMGAGLLYSEMVSAKGLVYNSQRTKELLLFTAGERPIALQIFGSEPETMAQGAKLVAEYEPDFIDINMGCPTPKIVKNGDGAALMLNPQLAYRVMSQVVQAVKIPVLVKIRKGWDEGQINAVQIAKLAQKAGIAAIAIHGRTREQFYSGKADWEIIRQVKEAVDIPVMGNGDVKTYEDINDILEITKCDGVMIGRAAMGNPWLFAMDTPSPRQRLELLLRHVQMLVQAKGEVQGVKESRKHVGWYIKGLPKASSIKQRVNQITAYHELKDVLEEYLDFISP